VSLLKKRNYNRQSLLAGGLKLGALTLWDAKRLPKVTDRDTLADAIASIQHLSDSRNVQLGNQVQFMEFLFFS
jgi:hypothetical protein